MKTKKITIKEIAQLSGVSVASVSRTINGLSGVGEDKRKKIIATCEEVGYVPNTLARGLVRRETKTIGIIVPDIQSPFYSRLMYLAGVEAKKYGYQILMCNSFRDYEIETNYFELLIGNEVDGILVFPLGEKSERNIRHFLKYVPIVSLCEMSTESGIPCVASDEYKSGELAADYLLRCGCQSVLYLGYTEGTAYEHRVAGFLDVVKRKNVRGEVFESDSRPKNGFQEGYVKFTEFWDMQKDLPDGIVASSDETARGILKACLERNLSVPDDFSLIGFDNIVSELSLFKITSVSISHEFHIENAVRLLMRLKSEKTVPEEEGRIFLQPRLFQKDSCKNIIL